jgi:hypothetical protein
VGRFKLGRVPDRGGRASLPWVCRLASLATGKASVTRLAVIIGVVGLSVLTGALARPASSSSARVVPCDDIISQHSSPHADGYRVVLGVVSVPPAYLAQVVRLTGQAWPYWRKAGIAILGGHSPVTVTVPSAWRSRAAITWGNSTRVVSSVRVAACPYWANSWNGYAGGFYLRSPSACVPLIFRVGRQSANLRFGVGRHCAP